MGESMKIVDGETVKKGFYISQFSAAIFGIVIVLILVAEGLIIGLVARPTCTNVASPDTTTTTAPVKTTTFAAPDTTTMASLQSAQLIKEWNSEVGDPMIPLGKAPGIWDNERLPLDLIPEHYWVDLRPVFDEFPTPETNMFYGFSSVRYRCDKATDYLILHSFEIEYTAEFAITDDDTGLSVTIVDWFFHRPNQYLVVQTASSCVEGKKYIFSAPAYEGILGSGSEGLYRSTYTNENGELRIIAVSQMAKTGARHAFPSFDEPAMKATFDITLRNRVDDGYVAISNMPVLRYEPETFKEQSWNATAFDTTNIMPTYLLAFVVADFTFESGATPNGTQTRIYARKEAIDNGEGVYSAWATPAILDHLAKVYKIPYTWPKSDQLSDPNFAAGAMENWGLVLYRESLLLVEDNVTTVRSKYSVTSVIAHELAHQWFGNLVSCAWWNEIWLNEGFATYVSYIGVDGVQPTWHSDEMFILDDLQEALSSDSRSTSHPLVHPEGYFSTIVYSKGCSVLRMINDFLGELTFTIALTNYLLEFQYGNAEHDDLFKHWINQAAADGLTFPYDLQLVFESWTLQMGYPLITVTPGTNLGEFDLKQEYFLVDPDDSPVSTPGSDTYNYQWYVPFTYKTESGIGMNTKNTIWMGPKNEITTISGSASDTYILGNIQAKGFYRIHYHKTLWDKIVAKLNSVSFTDVSPQTRAQLIDDAFNLVRANKMAVTEALAVTDYLYRDVDYIPWKSFIDEMIYFGDMLSRSPIYTDFRRKMVELIEPSLYSYYGWDDSNTDDDQFISRMARDEAITFACDYGSQDCIINATRRFDEWKMMTPVTSPSGNTYLPSLTTVYRTDVYCNGIREGTVEDWDFVFNQIPNIENYDYQVSLRWALSCSKDPWVLHRYLEYALDPAKIPASEMSKTFVYVAGKESGKYEAMSFLSNNWDAVVAAGTINASIDLIDSAVDLFSTEFDVSLLESMKDVAPASMTGTLNSYIDIVQENILWRSTHEADIGVWVGSAAKVNPATPRKRMYVREKLPNFNFAFRKKYRFSKPYLLNFSYSVIVYMFKLFIQLAIYPMISMLYQFVSVV